MNKFALPSISHFSFWMVIGVLYVVMSNVNASPASADDEPVFHSARSLNSNPKYLDYVKKSHPRVVVIYVLNNFYSKTVRKSRENFQLVQEYLKDEVQIEEESGNSEKAKQLTTVLDSILRTDKEFYFNILTSIPLCQRLRVQNRDDF